jgi:hypothetical protein
MKNKSLVFILTAVLGMLGILGAATLTYSPAAPQTGDSALIIANKEAVAATTTAAQTTLAAAALAVQNAGNSYNNITTATTTTVKTGAGVLESVIINSAGTGSSITIYANTAGSGTKIATLTAEAQIAIPYNLAFATGLTVVTASGTPANITIVYR